MIRKFPVDEQAISVFGFSSGGYGVWSMGRAFPGRFSALIPVSCNPHRDMQKYVVNSNTAVWTFNCATDGGVVLPRIEEEISSIHNKGGTAFMTTYDAGGHQIWRNALLETPLVDWLLWVRRDASPDRVPFGDNTAKRSRNDHYMLFEFPLYLCGMALCLGPLVVIGFEKVVEYDARCKQRGTEALAAHKRDINSFRIWTDTNARKAELRFMGFENGDAKFVSRSGQNFSMAISSLSEDDRRLLADIAPSAQWR